MFKPFYKQDDMQMRIVGGVVWARGEPTLITKYDGKYFQGKSLYGNTVKNLTRDEIDLTPVQTGNVSFGDTYVFTSRIPHRKYKQSLSDEAIRSYDMPFETGAANATSMLQPITNRYVKFEEALYAVANKLVKAIPFSREWGLFNDNGVVKVCYQNMEVGCVTSKVVKLRPEKFYLEQALRGVLYG